MHLHHQASSSSSHTHGDTAWWTNKLEQAREARASSRASSRRTPDPDTDHTHETFCFSKNSEALRRVWNAGLPASLRADVWATSVGADDPDIQVAIDGLIFCCFATL
jgi:hypothetical protein